ncbi:MAG: hypothetical protein AOA65_0868 [Candidatus Bathyarchaeota archaeon BA1]|nr:MAG: hypothetical protein AOA65_0868 [Candidatus Bathyarchaeota archaeon BA1]
MLIRGFKAGLVSGLVYSIIAILVTIALETLTVYFMHAAYVLTPWLLEYLSTEALWTLSFGLIGGALFGIVYAVVRVKNPRVTPMNVSLMTGIALWIVFGFALPICLSRSTLITANLAAAVTYGVILDYFWEKFR